ncbi:hypothetical protein BH10BAC2_BH10BAC2_14340 [soil metagenome]
MKKNMRIKIFYLLLIASQISFAQIGNWSMSSKGLPIYQYTGAIPFTALDKEGKPAKLPNDPYFLLGNYKMTLFAHASGRYQFLTGERAWARINADNEKTNYGWNDAQIEYENNNVKKKISLVGTSSFGANNQVQKNFSVGFARYEYQLDNTINCTRIISVKPSQKINSGNPAFVITVILKNNAKKTTELIYKEKILLNYVMAATQVVDKKDRPVNYESTIHIDDTKQIAVADFSCKANRFLIFPTKEERYPYDIAPTSFFMYIKNNIDGKYGSSVSANNDTLSGQIFTAIKPGETKKFNIIIGLKDKDNFTTVQQQVDDVLTDAEMNNLSEGLYASQWKNKLPDFSNEPDEVLKREMLWHAHVLEASAKYSSYYKETFIPQGSVYAYNYGDNISNRDNLQAMLPACYTNPALAKSAIRYVTKHSGEDGEIKRGNGGFSYWAANIYKESDEQLYFFNSVSEYLLITKDFAFLNEKCNYYPADNGKQDIVLNFLKKYFIYLRDEVGVGSHGLVKILNSDWSDSFFKEYSPNKYENAESHLNTAMVLAIFPKLIDALKQSGNADAENFIVALENYRSAISTAFFKDFGDRKFAARAYLSNSVKFGLDVVCLEPQGYLLQIPDLPIARKKEIYEYVKNKNFTPEQIGFRIREKPLWSKEGEGEDGAIWYSLEYPVLLGVAMFDKAEAKSLLKAFSFEKSSAKYPNYWMGQWTAADDINSSLSIHEGLYSFWDGGGMKSYFHGYCSHPHTWPLFCYFKLKE